MSIQEQKHWHLSIARTNSWWQTHGYSKRESLFFGISHKINELILISFWRKKKSGEGKKAERILFFSELQAVMKEQIKVQEKAGIQPAVLGKGLSITLKALTTSL